MVRELAGRVISIQAPLALPVLDIGSGSGIFTRQLGAYLPNETPIIGIEPASAMREKAVATTSLKAITYRDGTAETLPIEDGAARAVFAATAAHWFERPSFYREAKRALHIGGLLVIVEYVRNEKGSLAAHAVVEFLNRYGEPRAYTRPDYVAELSELEGFGNVETWKQPVALLLSPTEFAGLALSSSHARQVVETLGWAEAEAMIRTIGADLASEDGHISFGYLFQAFAVALLPPSKR
jgi:SAM-dependent methyltransferase